MKAMVAPGLGRSILGWGVSARVTASSKNLLEWTLLGLPSGFRVLQRPSSGPLFNVRAVGGHIEVTEGDRLVFRGRSRRALGLAVEACFETLASTHSGKFAFLHAGGVGIEGRAILFPGRSHAGKSTLVTAFLKRGASYLSDDMVPIDGELRAHPFPRPIGLRPTSGGVSKRTPLKKLGAKPADRALPIALVWCGVYDPLAPGPTFERRRGVAAFAELFAHAPGAQIRPEVIVPILSGMARRVPVFSGVRGDAEAIVDAVLTRLRGLVNGRLRSGS